MNASLRLRLVAIILIPLLAIALLIGAFAVYDAQQRAVARFDLSLQSAVLAISRDVAVSDGDALSAKTSALLRDTFGGQVFYHVYAPDGVFVTGYATPPAPLDNARLPTAGQSYFDGTYQGDPVRGLRLVEAMQIDGLAGNFTFTVWQRTAVRRAIVRDLSWRTFRVIAALIAAVGLIVWFGVRLGLRPLLDLEAAIARRSAEELAPIRRRVPAEAKGIVETLNQLLGQVQGSMQTKDDFISNAAHQLRNPIAGVVAMAHAVQSAKTHEAMKERAAELTAASQHASDLANKLLALERARGSGAALVPVDLAQTLRAVQQAQRPRCQLRNIALDLADPLPDALLQGDPTMLQEALINLIDNAVLHGGNGVNRIALSARITDARVEVSVTDNGIGIAAGDMPRAVERFAQVEPSTGSGLGLAIAQATAKRHGGQLNLGDAAPGLRVTLSVPLG